MIMKKLAINRILTFILTIIIIQSVSAVNTEINITSNEKSNSNTDKLWGNGIIYVHVEEIYGDVNNPKYMPLPFVAIKFIELGTINPIITNITDIIGNCHYYTSVGYYLIRTNKDGFTDTSSGIKGFKIIFLDNAQELHVNFILAENGSPFIQKPLLMFLENHFPLVYQLLTKLWI